MVGKTSCNLEVKKNMPTYQGGKIRIGKQISNVIEDIENQLKWKSNIVFEPFCGMLGVGLHFARQGRIVEACDANESLILFWRALQVGWLPPEICTEEEYWKLKAAEPSALRGCIGVACSYGGIFFGGFRIVRSGKEQNRLQEFKNSLKPFLPHMKNFSFLNARSYSQFNPVNKTIYVDPPYYKNTYFHNPYFTFDHVSFWQLMEKWSEKNLVFVSEYVAPPSFVCVWTKSITISHTRKINHRVEKLFIHNSWFKKLTPLE